jgi:hypothetical protein
MHDYIHSLNGCPNRVVVGQIRHKEVVVGNGEMGVALGQALGEFTRAVERINVVATRLLGQG